MDSNLVYFTERKFVVLCDCLTCRTNVIIFCDEIATDPHRLNLHTNNLAIKRLHTKHIRLHYNVCEQFNFQLIECSFNARVDISFQSGYSHPATIRRAAAVSSNVVCSIIILHILWMVAFCTSKYTTCYTPCALTNTHRQN